MRIPAKRWLPQGRARRRLVSLLICLIGGFSIALRRVRIGESVVLAVQAGIWLLFSLALSLMTADGDDPWFVRYVGLWAAGIEHMRTQSSHRWIPTTAPD